MEIKFFILLSLSLALILGIVESFEYDEEELTSEEGMEGLYERWRNHHNVEEVSQDEKCHRYNVFKSNVEHVHKTNQMDKPYKLKLNKFATLANHEFSHTYASSKIKHFQKLQGIEKSNASSFMYENVSNLPPAIDWRTRNAVTPAKDQLKCGNTFCKVQKLLGS